MCVGFWQVCMVAGWCAWLLTGVHDLLTVVHGLAGAHGLIPDTQALHNKMLLAFQAAQHMVGVSQMCMCLFSPIRARVFSFTRARVFSPIRARVFSPIRARVFSPIRARVFSPIRARVFSIRARVFSPTRARFSRNDGARPAVCCR
jgi:hypothetical protein